MPLITAHVCAESQPGAQLQVLQPFDITVDPDEDADSDFHLIATSPISLVYALGATWEDAVSVYLDVLADHLEWLTEEERGPGFGSPAMDDELARLRSYVRLTTDTRNADTGVVAP